MTTGERQLPATVADPDADTLGPAMLACTPLERRFVIALCEIGHDDYTRALAMSGSGASSKESLRVMASTMYRRPRVQEACKEEALRRLNSFGLQAVSNVIDLARSSRDEKIKLKANLELMNRVGMSAIMKHEVRHTDVSKTDDELVRRMVELVRRNPSFLDMVPEPLRPQVQAKLLPQSSHGEAAPIRAEAPTLELTAVDVSEPSGVSDEASTLFDEDGL